MSLKRSQYIIVLLALAATLGALAVDIYLPSLPFMASNLNSTMAQAQLTLSVYMFSFAISQLILGPLSDRFGRRPVIVSCLFLYAIASIACSTAQTIDMLIAARAIQAFGACAGGVTVFAMIRDIYSGKQSTRYMSYIAMINMISPTLAPLIGGYLQQNFDWRASFIFLSITSSFILIAIFLWLPESIRSKNKQALKIKPMFVNYSILIRNRGYMSSVGINTFGFTAVFAFISTSPYYFVGMLHVRPDQFGYYFGINALALLAGNFLTSRLTHFHSLKKIMGIGVTLMTIGAVLMAVLALSLPLSAFSILLPMVILSLGVTMMMPTATTTALAQFPEFAGTASALYNSFRFAISSTIAGVLGYFHSQTQLPLAITLLISVAIVAVCLLSLNSYNKRENITF